jgi:hypothetical protein
MEIYNVKNTVKKWYYRLDFPSNMDKDFERLLYDTELNDALTIGSYDTKEKDGGKNLLYFLFFCERLSQKYKEKGISDEILLATLSDIVTWTKTWSELKGTLYLGELEWLKHHLQMRLFKLGRLQFCIADSKFDIPEKGLLRGTPVIEVHIPEGEPLSEDSCVASLDMARDFFERYFPDVRYSLFTCHSWLLDSSLSEFLSRDSNILKFADLFKIVRQDPSDAIFGYLFRWGVKREEIKDITPSSSFAKKVKDAAIKQKTFYEGLGYIVK